MNTAVFLSAEINRRDESALKNMTSGFADAAFPFTLELTAEDHDQLHEAIARFSHSLGDPFRVSAIRLAEDSVCAELDVSPSPPNPQRLH